MSDPWAGGGFGGAPQAAPSPGGGLPFSAAARATIGAMRRFMLIAGGLSIVTSLVQLLLGIVRAIFPYAAPPNPTFERFGALARYTGACGSLLGVAVAAALGGMLFMSARAFGRVLAPSDSDVAHLGTGFRSLRSYFLLKSVVFVLLFLTCCILVGVGAAVGGRR